LMYQLGVVLKSEGSVREALAIFKSIYELDCSFKGVAGQIFELTGETQKR